ncbi:MAG: leucine-rich repeat domain-containing protein [Clostridiales bacterium]|nr:leucine-rich repeat domain-containing protein [Clostridiales bacterium]
MKKRILAGLFAGVLAVSLLSACGSTSGSSTEDEISGAESTTADEAEISGTCGENVTWTLDANTGALTISGSGDMEDYTSPGDAPWYSQRDSITGIVIADGVTSIGYNAFYGCGSLTDVTIGDDVISIVDYAFAECGSLASLIIPDSVTSVGDYVFEGCSSLTEILVSENNEAYSSEDGILLNRNKTEMVCYPAGKESASYEIPDNIISLANGAFDKCENLTSVTIPDSVTSIGNYVFYECSGLIEILVSADNTAYESTDGILLSKDGTEIICYPAGKEEAAYEIPENIITIGNGAFGGCESLTSMTIPDSVTSIGNWAFADCVNLASVTIPDSVASIGEGAFVACSSLASVTIPDSVTSINDYTFAACDGLTDVTIGNSVTSIGYVAFSGCTSLTSVVIPDSVVSIGDFAFEDCEGLASVTIPDSVTTIGEGAFYGCASLSDVYYGGSDADWEGIEIGEENDSLLSAAIH